MTSSMIRGGARYVWTRLALLLVTVAAAGVAPAVAQDFTLTPLEWLHVDDDTPDVLPVMRGVDAPDVPKPLRDIVTPTYVEVRVSVGKDGEPLWSAFQGSPFLHLAWQNARWGDQTFKPARRDGAAVDSDVRFFMILNPASASRGGSDASPRLLRVVAPSYEGLAVDKFPAFARPEGTRVGEPGIESTDQEVWVEARVDERGKVVGARSDDEAATPELRAVVEDAVRRWLFAPARAGGKTVAASVRVPVILSAPTVWPQEMGKGGEPPRPLNQPSPVYPRFLVRAGLAGQVTADLVVSRGGKVIEAHVVESNNPYFDSVALDAVRRWTFEPGRVKGVAVAARFLATLRFNFEGRGDQLVKIRPPKHWPDDVPEEFRWDTAPVLRGMSFAAYPYEALRDGAHGEVKVVYRIDPKGVIIASQVLSSPTPELAGAVIAMLDTYRFQPAAKNDQACFAQVVESVDFRPSGSGNVYVPSSYKSYMRRLEKDRDSFARIDELDGPLRAISQRPPVYPLSLRASQMTGHALVEFVIGKDGQALLPRVVTATQPEFGFAAVQAISTWRFNEPRRGGKAVDVLTQLPVDFSLNPR